MQEVYLDKNIKLLDTPGIVFSSGKLTPELVLRNCIKIEQLEDPIPAGLSFEQIETFFFFI
jgi:nuclear GTP-binding protein